MKKVCFNKNVLSKILYGDAGRNLYMNFYIKSFFPESNLNDLKTKLNIDIKRHKKTKKLTPLYNLSIISESKYKGDCNLFISHGEPENILSNSFTMVGLHDDVYPDDLDSLYKGYKRSKILDEATTIFISMANLVDEPEIIDEVKINTFYLEGINKTHELWKRMDEAVEDLYNRHRK